MQAIGGISRSTAVRLARCGPSHSPDATMRCRPRALVPVRPVGAERIHHVAQRYPAANFLAHLIAIRQRSPQTRARAAAPRRTRPAPPTTATRATPAAPDSQAGTRVVPLDVAGTGSIPERAAVLARIGAADQHAALPVDADRLPAAPGRRRHHHVVAARREPFDRRLPTRRAPPRSARRRRTRAARRSPPARPCRSRPCW